MDKFNITNNMTYDVTESVIYYDNIAFPVYAHQGELLFNHSEKTWNVFNNLVNEEIFYSFFIFFSNNNLINLSEDEFKDVIKKTVYFHDIGKISFSFQLNRLNKNKNGTLNEYGLKQKDLFIEIFRSFDEINYFDVNHSYTGAYIFLNYLSKYFNIKKNLVLLLFGLVIAGHHSRLLNFNKLNLENYNTVAFICELFENNQYQSQLEYNERNTIRVDKLNNYFKKFDKQFNPQTMYCISSFYQYIYSLLITSDVIASSQYELEESHTTKNNNRIDEDLLKHMKDNFLDFNKKLNKQTAINILRHEMYTEASKNLLNTLHDNTNNRMFYLNIPTGGGKTNTSMKLALDIIENTSADRIIYAMPFINILDQNYDVLRRNYGLTDNVNIRKICSTNSFLFADEEVKTEEQLAEILMNDDFLDYPVICTTFVRLFNTIIRNKKRDKYGFASISNSVVILDEVQSLPITNWSSIYYILNDISEKLNIYFIFMSATLPEFTKLDKRYEQYNYLPLIRNPQKYYDSNEFRNRARIMNKPFKVSIDDTDKLKEYLYTIFKENFKDGYNHGLIVLNTVKSSRTIYQLVKKLSDELDFEVDLLNSTIMAHNKKQLIRKINKLDDNQGYILVSTQSIEAGVDISFKFVIRDLAILDSIEQIMGRCNRHNELPNGKHGRVYLINLVDANNKELHSYIYNKEETETRIKETKQLLENDINYNFIDLKEYYENISKTKSEITINKEERLESNDNDNINSWNRMLYSKLNEKNGIHIIEDTNQVTLFLLTNIDISFFEKEEIKYLKDKEKTLDYNLIKDNKVLAENILKYYDFDQMKDVDNHTKRKILKKEFSTILDKFLINTYISDELRNEYSTIPTYEELNKEYYFFEVIPEELIGDDNERLYSTKTGLNHDYKYFNNFNRKCC